MKMIEVEGEIKKWGNSLAFRMRKNEAVAKGLKVHQRVKALIIPKQDVVSRTFGMFKGMTKKSGQQLKDEIRKEFHGM